MSNNHLHILSTPYFPSVPLPVTSLTHTAVSDATNSTLTVHWSVKANASFHRYRLTIVETGTDTSNTV